MAGCNRPELTAPIAGPQEFQIVPYVESLNLCKPTLQVIRDQRALRHLWRHSPTAMPEVDFRRQTLVVVSWEGSSHGCRDQIEAIRGVAIERDPPGYRIVVDIGPAIPGDCAMPVCPVEAILVDGANMPLVFIGEVPDTTGSGG